MTSLEAALREQAAACERLGSQLYAGLLRRAAVDVAAGGPVLSVLRGHERDPPGSVVALRLLAGVHRLVLTGRAPALAEHYPSAGGTQGADGAWEAFRATVAGHRNELAGLLEAPVQTNEVGRCAALLRGFLLVAQRTGLPLRLLELGASAGLNLRWDHVRYGEGADAWGPADSPVRLVETQEALPQVAVAVAQRRGCDAMPLDPASEGDRLTLRSCVWPDQPERLARLDAALALAAGVPATVDRAGAAEWLAARLAEPTPGVATIVFHSIVMQYLPDDERERVRALIGEAGGRARADAPAAWLCMEPAGPRTEVWLTVWPPGDERLVATAGYHGGDVRRIDLG